MTDITLALVEDSGLEDQLEKLLDAHADGLGFPFDNKPVNLTARIEGAVAGGLSAYTLYGWCFIKLLDQNRFNLNQVGKEFWSRVICLSKTLGSD
ncbi:MAG: hypothetical protein AAGH74_10205 [Pseudomonadota bacterium]